MSRNRRPRRTLLSTTVAACLALTVQVKRDDQDHLFMLPLVSLTGLLFALWNAHQAVVHHGLALADLVTAGAAAVGQALTSAQVGLTVAGIIIGALAWALLAHQRGEGRPCPARW